MAVTRTSTGALFSSAAAGTATFAAGAAAGNLGILIVETANQAITTPAGWTLLSGGAGTGFGVAGAAGASMLSIYYKDGISSGDVSGGISISDSGDHQNAVLLTYSGHDSTGRGAGAPVISSTNNQASTAGTGLGTTGVGSAGSIVNGDILLCVVGTDRDSATVSTNSGFSWSTPTGSRSVIVNVSSATGAGGGIIVDELDVTATSTNAASLTGTITSTAYNTFALQIFAPGTSPPFRNLNPMLPLLAQ